MKTWWLEQPDDTRSIRELDSIGVVGRSFDLDRYEEELDSLKRGHLQHDEVEIAADTSGLDETLERFREEHFHTEDEVRMVLEGEGLFDVRSRKDQWIRIFVQAGDLLIIPSKVYHRFFLTEKKFIRCLRLFKDEPGEVPVYRGKDNLTADEWKHRALNAEKKLEIRETEFECRALVHWFSDLMLRKFRRHVDKGMSWKSKKPEETHALIESRVRRLSDSLRYQDPREILDECADIANLAAMLADSFDRRRH